MPVEVLAPAGHRDLPPGHRMILQSSSRGPNGAYNPGGRFIVPPNGQLQLYSEWRKAEQEHAHGNDSENALTSASKAVVGKGAGGLLVLPNRNESTKRKRDSQRRSVRFQLPDDTSSTASTDTQNTNPLSLIHPAYRHEPIHTYPLNIQLPSMVTQRENDRLNSELGKMRIAHKALHAQLQATSEIARARSSALIASQAHSTALQSGMDMTEERLEHVQRSYQDAQRDRARLLKMLDASQDRERATQQANEYLIRDMGQEHQLRAEVDDQARTILALQNERNNRMQRELDLTHRTRQLRRLNHALRECVRSYAGRARNIYELARMGNGRWRNETLHFFGGMEDFASNTQLDPKESCTICYGKYDSTTAGMQRTRLPCGHTFHEGCEREWAMNSMTCPMCRADMVWLLGRRDELPDYGVDQTVLQHEHFLREQVDTTGYARQPTADSVAAAVGVLIEMDVEDIDGDAEEEAATARADGVIQVVVPPLRREELPTAVRFGEFRVVRDPMDVLAGEDGGRRGTRREAIRGAVKGVRGWVRGVFSRTRA